MFRFSAESPDVGISLPPRSSLLLLHPLLMPAMKRRMSGEEETKEVTG